MVPKMITFVIIVIAVALTCGEEIGEGPQPIPPSSTSTTTPSTTPSTKPTTTTVTSSTSTTTTTTTTTQHTTPSTKPTTPPPTEPTTNPPTTTDKPFPVPTTNTTTPKPAPTTPSPQPPKKPEVGKWNVTDHTTNVTCILVDMAIQLNISYIGNNNKTNHSIVYVPKSASANGDCGGNSSLQTLDLEWELNNKPFGNLGLVFSRNETTKRFVISYINFTVTADGQIFPGINKNASHIELFSNKSEFSTPVSKSYHCEKEQSFVLKNVDKNVTDSDISVSHVQLEAFHAKTDGKFGTAEDCEPSSSPDIVPIAVGCALVGLVAIVLIAYLVGRRRSQARGYLSM